MRRCPSARVQAGPMTIRSSYGTARDPHWGRTVSSLVRPSRTPGSSDTQTSTTTARATRCCHWPRCRNDGTRHLSGVRPERRAGMRPDVGGQSHLSAQIRCVAGRRRTLLKRRTADRRWTRPTDFDKVDRVHPGYEDPAFGRLMNELCREMGMSVWSDVQDLLRSRESDVDTLVDAVLAGDDQQPPFTYHPYRAQVRAAICSISRRPRVVNAAQICRSGRAGGPCFFLREDGRCGQRLERVERAAS